MKKLLIGCALLFFCGMIATCAGGYFFVWRPISSFATQAAAFTNFEQRLTNQTPFTGASDYRLTEAQVEAFVGVNRAVSAALGENIDGLSQALQSRMQNVQDVQQLMGAVGELRRVFAIAQAGRNAQVDALNAANLSLAEYQWIRDRFMTTLAPGVDLGQLQQSFQNGQFQLPQLPQLDPNGPLGSGGANADTAAAAPADAAPEGDKPDPAQEAPAGGKPDEAAAAQGGAAAPPTDLIAQLPGGREAWEHNRALTEPYRDEATTWMRNWAATF